MANIRLGKVTKELNVGLSTLVEHLQKCGFEVESKPTSRITDEMHNKLIQEFSKSKALKEKADQIALGSFRKESTPKPEAKKETPPSEVESKPTESKPVEPTPEPKKVKEEKIEVKAPEVTGPKVIGKIDLTPKPKKEKPVVAPETPPKVEQKKEEEKAPEKKVKKEAPKPEMVERKKVVLDGPKVIGKIDTTKKSTPKPKKVESKPKAKEVVKNPPVKIPAISKPEKAQPEMIKREKVELTGPKVVGKIVLPTVKKKKPVASSSPDKSTENKKKRKRKRIVKPGSSTGNNSSRPQRGGAKGPQRGGAKGRFTKGRNAPKSNEPKEISEKEIQDKIKATMAKLGGGSNKGKTNKTKYKRAKREAHEIQREIENIEQKTGDLQVTEFISVSELASLLDVSVTQVISTCMNLGVIVSINQRLDAEVIELVCEEFGQKAVFTNVEEEEEEEIEEIDAPEDLKERAPIVTVMGHVDHGKTSLLDYIRKANVADGEAGGITQHIGAYEVVSNGKKVTFLDTPGHEAFTAMRARGAKATDIAVIIVAADDAMMPQTKEAISHAQAAGVPMVFAINKIDKDGANPQKIKEQLSTMNILVEEWGGTFQSQDISAKTGLNVDKLVEKILLEAEMLELKANPNKAASGVVLEASLEKGRGYVGKMLVQAGTLKIGDMVVAGFNYGKVKAMYNERGQKVKSVGPASPIAVLGLDGAPQAGEKFKVYENESDAKQIASKRQQIIREQGIRAKKHITLDEIGRRLALGTFKELNVIIKGDVDGSIEALSDSLQKLSTEEIVVNVVHKAVGQITESDILLASASDAIVIAFQVRPSSNARKLAERESIEIRMYSVIYDAIDELKTAMEGMLEPTEEEKITGNIEVRETFKISKIGTIAGCFVLDGVVSRNSNIRLIRDGIVQYTGTLASLKRFKDDVKEVRTKMECGLNIKNYNDIKVGDIIEAYEMIEVKRTLTKKK